MRKLKAIAPEMPSLGEEPRLADEVPLPGHGLTAKQDRLLRKALGDFAAARKLLGLV